MKTKNGIELDLTKSEFKYMYKNYIFYFSSEFYLNNFIDNVDLFIEIEGIKIRNKYRLYIDLDLYLTFVFYKRIEKRGFYVINTMTNEQIKDFNFVSYLMQKRGD